MLARLASGYGRVLEGMLLLACAIFFVMTFLIGFDVLLRNIGLGGVPPSNELAEDALYLITVLAAPALLRRGQHIRVDIFLRMFPPRVGWLIEWLGDVVGIACCLVFVWYSLRVTLASYAANAVSIKTLVMPEWWLFVPMPVCFLLLAIEFVFRMRTLALGERTPRSDAVSAS